ncbi:hypothetical protein PMAYCL1PPCAC_07730 [Pristionchus mayeri]|uniref:SUZ domain-containing protein n=1 Tax=Pristionchus mayeri TaxID=1317129 RepID=A0AAN5CB47_9BILA|nr:hypothetical protein PMAYCL1PPCAC_07730 [Pristionchus mayeri]
MSMAVTESTEASSSVVADDWETGEAQQEEQLKNKQQQIRILKREKENREAAQKEHLALPVGFVPAPAISAAPADAKPIPAAPRKLLRRPASGPNMPAAASAATAPPADAPPNAETRVEEGEPAIEIPVEEEEKFKNLEKRKAVYDAARSRILGTDYKPEEVKAPVSTSCRSRSPEIELKQRMAMGGGGGGAPPAIPQPQMNMMPPPVNFSEPPPPLPPPHVMAAYQQHIMMAQQQTYFTPQSSYPQMTMQQMTSTSPVSSTNSNQGYRDIFDTQTMYNVHSTAPVGGQIARPPPLATMSLLTSALPPPPSVNGMMYSTSSPSLGAYGRPPPSMFQNPDIVFRHESARGGRRRKN